MKTFEELYEDLMNSDNNELSNAWIVMKKDSKKAKKVSLFICLIIDILIFICFLKNPIKVTSLYSNMHIIIPIIIINLFIFIIISILFSSKSKNKYNLIYKQKVINEIMNNFYDNLEYFPQKMMPEYIYNQVEYEDYDNYFSDDYFEAQINNKYSIQMAEVHTQEERRERNSDGEIETEIIEIFHGLFAKIQMDKSINSELSVVKNGQMFLDKNRLKMDSTEFEKYFDVKATNQIIGMQLLTADVMEELVEFENETKIKFDICIKENNIYLRFHSGSMFEVKNFKHKAIDEKAVNEYYCILKFTHNLSNKLINLIENTQI